MNYLLLAVLVVLNVLDVYYTKQALGMGIPEANPIMNWVIRHFSIVGLIVVKGFLLGILLILIPYIRALWITVAIGLCVAVYGWVVFNHLFYLGG